MSSINVLHKVSGAFSIHNPQLQFLAAMVTLFTITLVLYLDLPNLRRRRARENNRRATHELWVLENQTNRGRQETLRR